MNVRIQIKQYQKQNFVKRVETLEKDPPKLLFYLIPHEVEHPLKPGNRRVVFNGSRKYKGVSLNSQVLLRPNLLNSCVGVLLKMREKPVFVSCDIAKYYHQILVPPEEQSVQRFFYRPPDSKKPLGEFQIKVYFFGNNATPFVANYALRGTVQDMAATYPEAAKILQENSYVDNVIFSLDKEGKAIRLGKEIKIVSKHVGFTQTQFASSSKKVLKSLEPSKLSKPDLNLDTEQLSVEHILGLHIDCNEDEFKVLHNVN